MTGLRCALLAAAVFGKVAVEVTDSGSLRTHKPTSLAEMHASIKNLAVTVGQVQSEMDHVTSELEHVDALAEGVSTAETDLSVEAITNAKVAATTMAQETAFNKGYNQIVGTSNQLGSEMITDTTAVNSNSAGYNKLHDSFEGKSGEVKHYETDLGSATANVRNRRELFTEQQKNLEFGCNELIDWGEHAAPVVNIQTKSIINIEAWLGHLEGQISQVQDLVRATEIAVDSYDPSNPDFLDSISQDQINESGNPASIPSAAENESAEEIEKEAAVQESNVKADNTIDTEGAEENVAELKTAESSSPTDDAKLDK